MTDQQRNARIEFVEKLLVANGFIGCTVEHYVKENKNGNFGVLISFTWIELISVRGNVLVFHNQPLKPLREFIKLSNNQQP